VTTTVRLEPRDHSVDDERSLAANVRLSSLLASTHHIVSAGHEGYVVRSVVPERGAVEAKADSLPKAVGSLTEQISQLVLDAGSIHQWPAEWVQLLDDVLAPSAYHPMQTRVPLAPRRTKERNLSIGMSTSVALHQSLEERAQMLESTTSQVARELFLAGLAALDRSVENEDLDVTFAVFRDSYQAMNSGDTIRWMLRVERRKYLEAQMLAKELRCSLAQLAGWCVQHALRTQPVPAEA
jgi:hypothetical protein